MNSIISKQLRLLWSKATKSMKKRGLTSILIFEVVFLPPLMEVHILPPAIVVNISFEQSVQQPSVELLDREVSTSRQESLY